MGQIPFNRRGKSKGIGFITHVIPFAALDPVPRPAPIDSGNEVNRKPESMRTLERSRFCGPFGQKVVLPQRAAESLEDLKVGLEEAGFIIPGQRLRQTYNDGLKFRVERVEVANDRIGHEPKTPLVALHQGSALVQPRRKGVDPLGSRLAVGATPGKVHRKIRPKGGA